MQVRTLLEFGPDLSLGNKLHWNWNPLHTAILQARKLLVF